MYRTDEVHPDRICISCYRIVGVDEGSTCGNCGVPLVSLEQLEVVAELRKRARDKKAQPAKRRHVAVIGSSLALAAIGFVALVVAGGRVA